MSKARFDQLSEMRVDVYIGDMIEEPNKKCKRIVVLVFCCLLSACWPPAPKQHHLNLLDSVRRHSPVHFKVAAQAPDPRRKP